MITLRLKILLTGLVITSLTFLVITTTQASQNIFWTNFTSSSWVGTSQSVTKNATYWQISLSGTTAGGIAIGSPFSQQQTYDTQTSPWYITYQVVSNTNCIMRTIASPTLASIPGSVAITLTPGSATTTALTFTSPTSQQGMIGVGFYRNLGTADCVIKVYSITSANGTSLFDPSQQLGGSSSGGGSITPETIEEGMQRTNEILYLFALILGILTSIAIVTHLRKLYHGL